MASLVQERLDMAIESGRIRFKGEPVKDANRPFNPNHFNHTNPADWLQGRSVAGNAENISLLRKCE